MVPRNKCSVSGSVYTVTNIMYYDQWVGWMGRPSVPPLMHEKQGNYNRYGKHIHYLLTSVYKHIRVYTCCTLVLARSVATVSMLYGAPTYVGIVPSSALTASGLLEHRHSWQPLWETLNHHDLSAITSKTIRSPIFPALLTERTTNSDWCHML